MSLPRIRARGSGEALGLDYGRQARSLIRTSLDAYASIFQANAWQWERARRFALERVPWLDGHAGRWTAELRGVADGAGVDFLDVVALNLRTEILQAASGAPPEECTSLGVTAAACVDGHIRVAQNWDYPVAAGEAVVVLEVESSDEPFLVTIVEAGLLAKTGMNEHRVAMVTNALITDGGPAPDGLPYHFVLRAILESRSASAAIGAVAGNRRASAANYLIADADGVVFDLESAPGDHRHVRILEPQVGVIAHANHFVEDPREASDAAPGMWTDSWVRRQRVETGLTERAGAITPDVIQACLRDHAGRPYSVCRHPDPALPADQRSQTHFSVIYDLTDRTILLAEGPPCEGRYEDLPVDWPARTA